VIGGDEVARNLEAVAVRGTIMQVGLMGGGSTPVNVGMLLAKRARWIGTTLRNRPLEEKAGVARRFAAEVLPLFDSGLLRPIIDSVFPFDRIADAHRHMEANANTGKIVVRIA
jgi:NADPH:quinone reductase-like Zn-dependent oxidoreductase